MRGYVGVAVIALCLAVGCSGGNPSPLLEIDLDGPGSVDVSGSRGAGPLAQSNQSWTALSFTFVAPANAADLPVLTLSAMQATDAVTLQAVDALNLTDVTLCP
ncbi:MAG: hypothetical protein JST92_17730 [Deltaproteobacteria bacterium]|nr:hypothetical protein [Deltaproteobacteria bacterium]